MIVRECGALALALGLSFAGLVPAVGGLVVLSPVLEPPIAQDAGLVGQVDPGPVLLPVAQIVEDIVDTSVAVDQPPEWVHDERPEAPTPDTEDPMVPGASAPSCLDPNGPADLITPPPIQQNI